MKDLKTSLSLVPMLVGFSVFAQDQNLIEFRPAKRTALICLQNIQADRMTFYNRESAPEPIRRYFQYADGQGCYNVTEQLNQLYPDYAKDKQPLFVAKESLGSTRVGGQLLNVLSLECQALDCQGLVLRIKMDQAKLFRQLDADNGVIKSKSNLDNFNEYVKNYLPDTVSKVLNYSSGCPDFGCKDNLWINVPGASCKYRRITPTNNSASFVDFDKIDFKSIKIEHVGAYTKVTHQGETLTSSAIGLDTARLKRGWDLIPSQACKGYKKEF